MSQRGKKLKRWGRGREGGGEEVGEGEGEGDSHIKVTSAIVRNFDRMVPESKTTSSPSFFSGIVEWENTRVRAKITSPKLLSNMTYLLARFLSEYS